MKQYKLTVTYRRTRPYYPDSERNGHLELAGYYQQDINEVGKEMTLVVGPYRTLGAVKAEYNRAKNSYPLANIYGDYEVGYEILDERWEEGEVIIRWKPVQA